ncbi:MAG: hypothetical protein HY721_20620 [Planctomycetes bacterium]|nr:hypothetical protein [Planctomycetota bacterium]
MTQGDDTRADPQRTILEALLRNVRRRVLADRLLRNASLDLTVALSAFCLLILADRLTVPGVADLRLLGALAGASLAVSLLRTILFGRLDRFRAAVLADERLELKERASTAVYARTARASPAPSAAAPSDELCRLLETDAERTLAAAPLAESFPVRLPRRSLWVLAPAALALGLFLWVPAVDLLGLGARKEARKDLRSVQEEEKKLEEKLKELAERAKEKNLPDAKKLLDLLGRQAESPEKKEPSEPQAAEKASGDPRKEALVEMTRREDAIKKGLEGQKYEPLKEALKALKALDLKNLTVTKKLQEALKDGDLKRAQKELSDLKGDLSKLLEKSPSELTAEEKARLEKLSEELSRLGRDSKALSKLGSALSKASSQLGAGQFQESLDSLQKGLEELESLASLSDEMGLLEDALELVELSKEELASLEACPECGTPYCPDCGKPQCGCKPGSKPGGT